MKKRNVIAVAVCALVGLGLVLDGVGPTAATQPQAQVQPQSQAIKGRLVNLSHEQDCESGQLCRYAIKTIAMTDRGELIEGSITGVATEGAAAAGQLSPLQGYGVWTYPDGSTIVTRTEGASKINGAGQLVAAGTQTCIDGTGRFANMDCQIDWDRTSRLAGQSNGLAPGSFSGTITPKA